MDGSVHTCICMHVHEEAGLALDAVLDCSSLDCSLFTKSGCLAECRVH